MQHRSPWRACLAAIALLPFTETPAQLSVGAASTLSRADSAWTAGDRARARMLYSEVLARDSMQSRAVFRLAQLEPDDDRSLALYRRYVALEPDDPWGHMAEGDRLAQMGLVNQGLVAYEKAHSLAPGERDVAFGRARLLERAGQSGQAADELVAWTSAHPGDGEAWDLLGRLRMRSGRPKAAIDALENAAERRIPGSDERLAAARANAAPAVLPEFTSFGDSDGNRTTRFGGALDFMPADGFRLGVRVQTQGITSDAEPTQPGPQLPPGQQQPPGQPPTPGQPPVTGSPSPVHVSGTDVAVQLVAAPAPGVRLTMDAGASRFEDSTNGSATWTVPRAKARIRARTSPRGPSMDLRLDRGPVGFSALLVTSRVVRSEARAALDVPAGAFRLRGTGWLGQFESSGEPANGRAGGEGSLVMPLGSGRVQPSVNWRLVGFERASTAGYFAPQRAESVEGGLYIEGGDEGPWSVAADLGGGMQRVTEHGGVPGPWSPAWRAWANAAFAIGPSRAWFLELEAYDAPFALEGAATAGSWRFLSVNSGIRWALR